MRRLAAILAALALPLVVLAPMSSAAPPTLTYGAHVSSLGWLPDVASPATAGTEATLTARYVADAGNRAYADAFVVTR